MKDQLRLLVRLQEMDARTLEARQAIEALPKRLEPAKQDLAKLEALLDREREELASTEKWRAEQEDLVRREEDAIKSAKAKVQAAKNARDFAAANREVDNKRRSIAEREAEVLKVLEALEQTRKNLADHEADVGKLRDHVTAEEGKNQEHLKELEAKVAEQSAGRDEITGQIRAEILKRYEIVLKRRGIAVVPVRGGVCQGCFMNVAARSWSNQLARGDDVATCPTCHRLLYRPDALGLEEDSLHCTGPRADAKLGFGLHSRRKRASIFHRFPPESSR